MNAINRIPASTSPSGLRFRASGFTLVELLVVITIIVVLAALSTVGISNMRVSAAKARSSSQLRQIAVGVSMWAGEKNNGEPFYAANGSGTYPNEGVPGTDPILAPANPATALFNIESPEDGYVTDHSLFYSPLAKYTVPTRKDYKPDQASETRPWGAYTWYYPSDVWEKLTPRQLTAIGGNWAIQSINPAVANKILLASDYTYTKPAFSKEPYMVLFVDGSVREVAQSKKSFDLWSGMKKF